MKPNQPFGQATPERRDCFSGLSEAHGDKVQIAEAQAELLRAVAQLRAIERLRKKR